MARWPLWTGGTGPEALWENNAWRNEGGFEVVVQSLLVSGTGKAVAAMRRRSKAEDKDSVGSLVEGIMSENQSSASEE